MMAGKPRCYWCNREVQPDDLSMGLVLVEPTGDVPLDDVGLDRRHEPRPFHSVCLGAIGGTAVDD